MLYFVNAVQRQEIRRKNMAVLFFYSLTLVSQNFSYETNYIHAGFNSLLHYCYGTTNTKTSFAR
jgi:hypothetical protein